MKILSEIDALLTNTKCSAKHFSLDKENQCVNCLDKEALINCNEECGIITKLTWLLIQNNIDYTVTKNFDIILEGKA